MIGVVVVSHSRRLAEGVAEVVAQMAPEVVIAPAGGTDEGEVGTSFDLVSAAIDRADTGDGAVVLYDLGSALMTAELALETLDDARRARVRLVDAPLVEGAMVAATTAAGDAGMDAVVAALTALGGDGREDDGASPDGDGRPAGDPRGAPAGAPETSARQVELVNPLGLHARPAAAVVRALAGLDADVRVEHVGTGAVASARSLLALVGLNAVGGDAVRVSASGRDAPEAVERLCAMAADGFGEAAGPAPEAPADRRPAEDPSSPQPASQPSGPRPGAPGIAVGPASRLRPPEPTVPDDPVEDPEAERRRLTAAQRAVAADLGAAARDSDVFAAHSMLLEDPTLTDAATGELDAGRSAPAAWWSAVVAARRRLADQPGEVAAARAADVTDVGLRVLAALGVEVAPPDAPAGTVAVADDLVPSQVPALVEAQVSGAVLRAGAPTAHVTILARALGLPLVLRAGEVVDDIADGTVLLVDGERGSLVVDPSPEQLAEARAEQDRISGEAARARAAAAQPVHLADGTRVIVAANAASVAEARAAVDAGADGVGLLRTEFLVADRPTLPSEDEQVAALAAVLDALDGRPAIIRTLDVGGDKPAPALDLDPVRHGALGERGLRLGLARPDLLATQLRAILRVAAGRRVSLMFPMVTAVEEVRAARRALDGARRELDERGVAFGTIEEVGMMVEVPAAALTAERFVDDVDFFSVGSNDLTQYVFAADRTNPAVADLARADSPPIYRLVERLCHDAVSAGRWVGVCGELAAEPDAAARLVSLGVRELSMAPSRIPAVKARLRSLPD